jgi:catechol 2,3-dioxygenase-like lactoylglutathione lyase family enzyme
MLGAVHHVGYLAADLDGAIAQLQQRFGSRPVRRFRREQWSLEGVYLGAGEGDIEVFTFTAPELLERRLAGRRLVLDHVAYEVEDISVLSARMRAEGVRFCGPDLDSELDRPADLGGALHLWTRPETCWGLSLQLLQPAPLGA